MFFSFIAKKEGGGRGVTKNQYRGGLGKKEGDGVFLRWGGGDAPMHTMVT